MSSIVNKVIGRHYDLTVATGGGGSTYVPEPLVGKTAITYASSRPTVVLKYEDVIGTILMYTTNITWVDGKPTQVVTVKDSNSVTVTTTLNWVNGFLESVTKISP